MANITAAVLASAAAKTSHSSVRMSAGEWEVNLHERGDSMIRPRTTWIVVSFSLFMPFACSKDEPPPENASQPCTSPAQCYPNVEAGAIKGEVTCLTKVPGGYCTHTCTADTDCCAVEGECTSGHPEVCSLFENVSTPMYCFLSCEEAQWQAAGAPDGNTYCQMYANASFTCRSTGGGSLNRKICLF